MRSRNRLSPLAILLALGLSACSGAGNVAPTTGPQIPSSTQSIVTSPQGAPAAVGTAAVSERDALATAQSADFFHATLPVQPSSLTLTLPTAQTLTVTVKRKTDVFAASSDPKIATVSPDHVNVDDIDHGLGTATFTVTPHATGKAVIGLIDSQRRFAIVPVTVSAAKVGASKIYVVNDGYDIVTTYTANGTPTTPTITGLNSPAGVAVDAAGKIYVANNGNDTVTTYTANGVQTTPTITGLNNPTGVAVDAAGKIYVANVLGNTVTTYTANGTPTTPTITTGLNGPEGVAVDAAGKIYVANNGNDTVTTYTANGVQTTPTITGLNQPWGVAVDAAGKIYVANIGTNIGNGTVTTYTANGTPTTPTITGLSNPYGVAIDAAGKIYVANHGNNAVTTYTAAGVQTTPMITATAGLHNPLGIAVH